MGRPDAQARGFAIGAGERERKRRVLGSLSGARWKVPQSTGDGVAEIEIGLFAVSPTTRHSDSSTLIGSSTMSKKLAMACRVIWRRVREEKGKGKEEGEILGTQTPQTYRQSHTTCNSTAFSCLGQVSECIEDA